MINNIEEKRDKLNLNIRSILAIIDMIDGVNNNYENYIRNTMDEEAFLDQQLKLVEEAKTRLINIFKD